MPHCMGYGLFSASPGMVLFPAIHDLSVKCICNFQISPPLKDLRQQVVMKNGGTTTDKWIVWGSFTSSSTISVSVFIKSLNQMDTKIPSNSPVTIS